ncbi:MAG: type II toxin-antitoxin system PemK/MazF family toxin [Alphaproteobacteria bacterium]|nr:type II toxin-antitoxin system PemK/MazF family toxin [Alphaproteobacteria bacterium]
MAPYVPERGDFARIVLDQRTGREQSGERPVLVLSPRAFNAVTGYAFVAPITRTIRRWPFEVALPEGARVEGAVLVDQAKSIYFVARHARFIGHAPDHVLEAVLARLSDILLPMPGTP